MNSVFLNFIFSLIFASVVLAKTVQIEQKSSGKVITIEVLDVKDGMLSFKMTNGKTYSIKLNELTDKSVTAVEKFIKENPPTQTEGDSKNSAIYEKLNEYIGHKLFANGKSLWKEKGATIAGRLNWELESLKESTSSYRLYTDLDYQFLGAHPYCVTLYGGKDDMPEQFSLVYANKGDFGSRLGFGPDHFKKMHPGENATGSLEEAILMDQKLIAQKLTEALGKPTEQFYGEKEDRRKVQRWDITNHSFILSALEGEYVHLIIVPKENADADGRIDFVKDSDLKKIQLTNVRKEKNGDVWIDNIPMVNQGPKGYCAPATFERAMRYMHVPADMYLLATAATSPEGGTDTLKLAEDSKRIVRSKARRIRELNLDEDFEIKKLRKFIDEGVPILWQMRSLDAYNDIASERTIERQSITNMKEWAEKIQAEADTIKTTLTAPSNYHICLVIGYNEETNEVAVSDSWGPEYELRWVHADIAKAVTSLGGFVIDF